MWESKCFSFGKLSHDAVFRPLELQWLKGDSWVISRPSSIIRQTAPRFCSFGECPQGTVFTRMYSKFPHPFRFGMAVCLCVLSWCYHYHYHKQEYCWWQTHKRQNPAMSLQKSVFTSDDLLQLMLNLLAQVPWGANNKDILRFCSP